MSRAMIWALCAMVIASLIVVCVLTLAGKDSTGVLMIIPTVVAIYAAQRADTAVKGIGIVQKQTNGNLSRLIQAKTIEDPGFSRLPTATEPTIVRIDESE